MPKNRSILPGFFLFLAAITLLCGALFCCRNRGALPSGAALPTVVIDPGHGGEDGGASDNRGRHEKDLNLAIAKKLRDDLVANGVLVILTREDDRLLYDRNSDYEGQKKRQDLAARLSICEAAENPIFVSIHMNAFPQSQYRGLQVWYSQNNPDSEGLARAVEDRIKAVLQPENKRQIKAAGSNIYLLSHLTCPAILIECGFLSNPAEAELLQSEDYQNALAKEISAAIRKSIFPDS